MWGSSGEPRDRIAPCNYGRAELATLHLVLLTYSCHAIMMPVMIDFKVSFESRFQLEERTEI